MFNTWLYPQCRIHTYADLDELRYSWNIPLTLTDIHMLEVWYDYRQEARHADFDWKTQG